jgi:DNA-binding winged helix-turn-helix (wHTH) protein
MKVRFGERELDLEARELRLGDGAIHLTPKAFQLLELLLEKRPNAVSKSQIQARLWPATFVSEVNLATLVFELRKALNDDARSPRWLRTVRGFGYGLCPDAEVRVPSPAPTQAKPLARLVWGDRQIPLEWGDNLLGRSSEAVALIDDTGVSRRHAVIRMEPGQAVLTDCGSKNGTHLNGHRVASPEVLSDRDEIGIGRARLVYREVLEIDTETV